MIFEAYPSLLEAIAKANLREKPAIPSDISTEFSLFNA